MAFKNINLGMCLISGYQTVGEEYVNIIQIDKHKRNIPSKLVILYVPVYMHIYLLKVKEIGRL